MANDCSTIYFVTKNEPQLLRVIQEDQKMWTEKFRYELEDRITQVSSVSSIIYVSNESEIHKICFRKKDIQLVHTYKNIIMVEDFDPFYITPSHMLYFSGTGNSLIFEKVKHFGKDESRKGLQISLPSVFFIFFALLNATALLWSMFEFIHYVLLSISVILAVFNALGYLGGKLISVDDADVILVTKNKLITFKNEYTEIDVLNENDLSTFSKISRKGNNNEDEYIKDVTVNEDSSLLCLLTSQLILEIYDTSKCQIIHRYECTRSFKSCELRDINSILLFDYEGNWQKLEISEQEVTVVEERAIQIAISPSDYPVVHVRTKNLLVIRDEESIPSGNFILTCSNRKHCIQGFERSLGDWEKMDCLDHYVVPLEIDSQGCILDAFLHFKVYQVEAGVRYLRGTSDIKLNCIEFTKRPENNREIVGQTKLEFQDIFQSQSIRFSLTLTMREGDNNFMNSILSSSREDNTRSCTRRTIFELYSIQQRQNEVLKNLLNNYIIEFRNVKMSNEEHIRRITNQGEEIEKLRSASKEEEEEEILFLKKKKVEEEEEVHKSFTEQFSQTDILLEEESIEDEEEEDEPPLLIKLENKEETLVEVKEEEQEKKINKKHKEVEEVKKPPVIISTTTTSKEEGSNDNERRAIEMMRMNCFESALRIFMTEIKDHYKKLRSGPEDSEKIWEKILYLDEMHKKCSHQINKRTPRKKTGQKPVHLKKKRKRSGNHQNQVPKKSKTGKPKKIEKKKLKVKTHHLEKLVVSKKSTLNLCKKRESEVTPSTPTKQNKSFATTPKSIRKRKRSAQGKWQNSIIRILPKIDNVNVEGRVQLPKNDGLSEDCFGKEYALYFDSMEDVRTLVHSGVMKKEVV